MWLTWEIMKFSHMTLYYNTFSFSLSPHFFLHSSPQKKKKEKKRKEEGGVQSRVNLI